MNLLTTYFITGTYLLDNVSHGYWASS